MLGRHLVACDKQLAKSEIEKAAKSHNSRLGFPQCCALFVMRDGFIISGSQFFERPIEFLFEALDRMYDGNKYGYLAMVIMMFQKDGILFGEKLANPDDDTQFRDKMLDLAFICQIPQSDHIFRFTLEGLQTQVGTFVNYYGDRDCFTFSHESIMEAMMASFGERHPQEVLEGNFNELQNCETKCHFTNSPKAYFCNRQKLVHRKVCLDYQVHKRCQF